MAKVTVYNRDGSVYGTLETSRYVFNNNVIGFEPVKLDTNLYPYVKVNGTYFVNDGEEFYSKGRLDNSSGLSSLESLYREKNQHTPASVYFTDSAIEINKTNSAIKYESGGWNTLNVVNNYGIQGKGLIGSLSPSTPSVEENFFNSSVAYGDLTFQRTDGIGVYKPHYWSFIKGAPVVYFSNLNWENHENTYPSGTTTTTNITGPIVEQAWVRDSVLLDRDNINRNNDDEWWNKTSYLYLTSNENSKNNSGIKFDDYYQWYQMANNYTSVSINRYTPASLDNPQEIVASIKENLQSNQKVILVKRPLIDLQTIMDDYKRFFFVYGSSYYTQDTYLLLSTNVVSDGGPFIAKDKENQTTAAVKSFILNEDEWTSGYFENDFENGWADSCFKTGKEVINIDVSLNDLEFYDITEKVKNSTLIFPISNHILSTCEKITPMWKDDMVISEPDQTFTFSFPAPGAILEKTMNTGHTSNGYVWGHAGVEYKITVKNIKKLYHEYHNTFTYSQPTAASYHLWTYNKSISHRMNTGESSIPSSVVLSGCCNWTIPLWFSNRFVNLTHNSIGLFYRTPEDGVQQFEGQGGSYIGRIFDDWDSCKKTEISDTFHSSFQAYYGISGWSSWGGEQTLGGVAGNGLNHIAPSMHQGKRQTSTGRYCAVVAALNPFSNPSNYKVYYPMSPQYKKNKGVQVGATIGILINHPSADYMSSNGSIPNTTENAYAIIVCNDY